MARKKCNSEKAQVGKSVRKTCMCFSRHCSIMFANNSVAKEITWLNPRVGVERDYQAKDEGCGYRQAIMQSKHFREIPVFQLSRLCLLPIEVNKSLNLETAARAIVQWPSS